MKLVFTETGFGYYEAETFSEAEDMDRRMKESIDRNNKTISAIKKLLGIEWMEGDLCLTLGHDESVQIEERTSGRRVGVTTHYMTLSDDGTFCVETST